jgi:hypothetical protein
MPTAPRSLPTTSAMRTIGGNGVRSLLREAEDIPTAGTARWSIRCHGLSAPLPAIVAHKH